MSGAFPAPVSPPQAAQQSAIGNLLSRVRALEAVLGGAGGEGIQFTSGGVYGADNYGAALVTETNSYSTSAFHFPSNVTPDNVAGGGEPHNNKYGALFTVPIDAPFYVFALNVFNDSTGAGSGFANGIEVVCTTDGPAAKGIDVSVDASDGTGGADGIVMGVTADGSYAYGITIEAENTTAVAVGADVSGQATSGNAFGLKANGSTSSGQVRSVEALGSSQSGNVWGGYFQATSGSSGTPDTIGVAGLGSNSTLGDSVGVDGIGTQSGTSGDAIGGRFKGANVGSGAAIAIRCVDAGNSPIFEVWEDGSVQGLASVGTITWDL